MAEDYGPSLDELQELARMVGCRVDRTYRAHDGVPIYEMSCNGHREKVALLALLATYDAQDGRVRRIAEEVASHGEGQRGRLEALHAFVRDGVEYVDEPVETFQHTLRTIELGIGDCDCTARALAALAYSLGYSVGLATLDDENGDPHHVAAVVELDGEWLWLETTIAAELGESPLDAAARLGIATRPDLVARKP